MIAGRTFHERWPAGIVTEKKRMLCWMRVDIFPENGINDMLRVDGRF